MKKILTFGLIALLLGISFSFVSATTESLSDETFSDLPNIEECGVGFVYDETKEDCVESQIDWSTTYDCEGVKYYCPIGQELLLCPLAGEKEECTPQNPESLLNKIEELKRQLEILLGNLI